MRQTIIRNTRVTDVIGTIMKTVGLFQNCFKLPIVLALCFGLFSVYGVLGKQSLELNFKWRSWRTCYSIVTFVGFIYTLFARIYGVLHNNNLDSFLDFRPVIFELMGVINWILFLKLAMEWPRFVRHWQSMEYSMRNLKVHMNYKKQIKIIITVFMTIATVEHFLIASYNLKVFFDKNLPFWPTIDLFLGKYFYDEYKLLTYSPWFALIFQMIKFQRVFLWTFNDIFLILVSLALTFHLEQIHNQSKLLIQTKNQDIRVWREIREIYEKFYRLFDYVNDQLSWLIIHSFFTNTFFIIMQLFGTLHSNFNILGNIYFYMSFLLVIARLTCVCNYCSQINDVSKQIIATLNTCPTSCYNIEVERFLTYLSSVDIVLSGKNYFSITKGLILKIAGAIVTYELVLIQFNVKNPDL